MNKGRTLTASGLLERFLFDKDQQYQYVSTLSGGEKRRLYLCTGADEEPERPHPRRADGRPRHPHPERAGGFPRGPRHLPADA
ncbi:MAG: hypothetical protein R2818_11645 [Flavobacteriales bacterium]